MENWSPKRVENYVGAAREIAQMCREAREAQTKFLADRGLTWEQARALPENEKRKLQIEWEVANIR